VYGNANFSYMRDYTMWEAQQGKRAVHFYPETAYWYVALSLRYQIHDTDKDHSTVGHFHLSACTRVSKHMLAEHSAEMSRVSVRVLL
jgi:hypothetical protein